ncbi:MAG TPA: TIM barrel protein [Abditibacteriaceae bacterium]
MNTISIGINGRFFPSNWRPALDEIAFADAHGFTALQFPGKEEGLNVEHLGADVLAVRDALARAGITATMEILLRVDHTGRTAAGCTPLEVLHANLAAITSLPCPYVHWHLVPSVPMDAAVVAALEAHFIPEFAAGVALAQHRGFRLGFEHNEPDLRLFGTPLSCQHALEAVPNLNFIWDFNHTIPGHITAFQALVPRMSLLHVSDTPLPEVNHHLPLGLGSIDFAHYCHALREGSFVGPAILEIGGLPKSGGYGRDTDEALIDSAIRLRRANDASG